MTIDNSEKNKIMNNTMNSYKVDTSLKQL